MDKSVKRKIKIVIDARFAESSGGIGRYITQIAKKLNKKRFDITLVSTKNLVSIQGNRGNKEVTQVILPQKTHWLFWEQVQLPILLKKLKPDIYHAAGNWGVPILLSCPVVLTVHDIIPLTETGYFNQSQFPWLSQQLYYWREKVGLMKASKVIFDSQQVCSQIKAKIGFKSQPAIIPLGVGEEFFKPKAPFDKVILAKLGVTKPYIVNHGGIDRRKNLTRLIEAFAQLLNSNTLNEEIKRNLKLVIAGNGKTREQLIGLGLKLNLNNRLIFPGWVMGNKLAVLVRNAQLDVYPTMAEGFGLPLIEGIAAGVPVIVSDLPILRTIGNTFPIYVSPYQTESIARGMLEGLNKRYSKANLKSWAKWARQFSWGKNIKKLSNIYSEVAERRDGISV